MALETEHRCFIGGLSWETTDRELEDAFRPYGNILEAKVVVNRDTGRSKGFGFVTFREEREMQEAIEQMHGMKLDGRPITVDKASGRGSGGGGGGGGRSSGGASGGDGCFKCGQSGHWARDCSSGGGGRRDGGYSRGGDRDRDGKSDRYGGSGGGSRYGSDRSSGDRYGRSGRENGGGRDRYSSGGPSRNEGGGGGGGGYRDRSGPYDRESGGKYGSGSASGRRQD